MTNDESRPAHASTSRSIARLRMIGTVVLFAGLVGAGLVYALARPPEDLPDSLSDPAAYKKSATQMQTIYGRTGAFSYRLTQALEDPAIQAAIIAVGAVIVAGGFFWVAEMKKRGEAQ